MKVQVYDCDANGNETPRAPCDLLDCFPDRDDDYETALAELRRSGRVWVGGGAMPLTIIMSLER